LGNPGKIEKNPKKKKKTFGFARIIPPPLLGFWPPVSLEPQKRGFSPLKQKPGCGQRSPPLNFPPPASGGGEKKKKKGNRKRAQKF